MASVTLLSILSKNADTELGKRWNFAAIRTLEGYRRTVPLTTYEVYRPFIDRMVNSGEDNLIATGKVFFFAPTSGSTSESKLFPRFSPPPMLSLPHRRNMLLFCWHKSANTPMGVPITPANTAVIGATIDANPFAYAAPLEAYRIQNLTTALYVQLVFGMKDSYVESIWSPFCNVVLTAFRLLEQEWVDMVSDIRSGTLRSSLDLTEAEREVLQRALNGPDPKRADELQTIFERDRSFGSVAHYLWPKLVTVDALAGGPLSSYIPKLQHYLGAHVHLFSSVYAASEGPGIFGINESPGQYVSAYTLQTSKVFFEFIPMAEIENDSPTVLLAEELKLDEVYEIVITTSEGLYRYRIGDLVKVMKISPDESKSPVVDIMGRTKTTLSVYAEKVTEFHVTTALTAIDKGPWKGYAVSDFTVTADMKSVPPRHNWWIEVSLETSTNATDFPPDLTSGAAFIDSQLAEVNGSYGRARDQGMIAPPTITLVAEGTFSIIMKVLKQRSTVTETQLKIPHTTADPELIDLLYRNTIA